MSKNKKLILGIDAGGTKTEVAAADTKGKILARAVAGPGSIGVLSLEEVAENIAAALFPIIRKMGIKKGFTFHKVVIGMAGFSSRKSEKEIKKFLAEYFSDFFPKNIILVNDTIIAFRSGASKKHGIGIIAGTGSNCYGVNKKGKTAWSGGLGTLLSDEGSAYMIGMIALHAATRSNDGRGPKTALEKMLKDHAGVKQFREIIKVYSSRKSTKQEIGELAKIVDKAAKKGDTVAQAILKDAGLELALMVAAVVNKLNMQEEVFEIVAVGGVFEGNNYVYNTFKKAVKTVAPKAKVIKPRVRPVSGAIRIAIGIKHK